MPSPTGMQIYDPQGHRLYLTGSERRRSAPLPKPPPGGPHLLLDVTVYGLSALGGPGAHRRSGGFPGGGPHL